MHALATTSIGFVTLPFSVLRTANIQRLPLFTNKHGAPAHAKTDGSDWTDPMWLQAIAGELGEYANVRKKFDRKDFNLEEYIVEAAKELADVITYVDIFCYRVGIQIESFMNYPTFGENVKWMEQVFPNDDKDLPGTAGDADEMAIALVNTLRSLGEVGAALEFSTRFGANGLGRSKLFSPLYALVQNIFYLAHLNGLDLGAAVVQKFNAISLRVKADVYIIQQTSSVTMPTWIVSDVPF